MKLISKNEDFVKDRRIGIASDVGLAHVKCGYKTSHTCATTYF